MEKKDLAIVVTLNSSGTSTPRPWALIEMLQEEGARVGLGGGYQPQPGGGQVGQELVCNAARPCGED